MIWREILEKADAYLTGLKIEVLNADGGSTEPVPTPAEPDFPADAGEVDDMPF